MINTYNETDLHASLKKIYATEYEGRTEIPVGSWICDIVTPEKQVFEIQTANISKLAKKTDYLLEHEYKVTIVHPLAVKKTIATYSEDGGLVTKRKSPRQESIYSILRELTGIYPLLTESNFSLEVLFTEITEYRTKTALPTQLKNKSRRFLRNWIPAGKKLETILKKQRFSTAEDYRSLIPKSLTVPFSIPELEKAISALPEIARLGKSNQMRAAREARLLVWLFVRMKILSEYGKKGRSRLYTFI